MLTSGEFLAYIILGAAVLVAFYAAFWAFNIRSALFVRTYKRQALGLGLVALIFYIFWPYTEVDVAGLLPYVTNGSLGLWLITYYPPFAIFLLWLDNSVSVARLSDPLLRDPLRWKVLRRIVWVASLSLISLYSLVVALNSMVPIATGLASVIDLLGVTDLFWPLLIGGIALFIGARRSGDETLRRQLDWFTMFVFAALVAALAAALTYPIHHEGFGLLSYPSLFAGAYFLYRSVRALAPVNRLALDGT